MIISGKVVKGSGQSTSKGFPTANINIRRKIPKGVFVASAQIDNKKLKGLLIVGAPTKHIRKFPKIEFFCLTKINCRGQQIKIKPLKKLRPIIIFDQPTKLIKQIKRDIQVAKSYLKKYG